MHKGIICKIDINLLNIDITGRDISIYIYLHQR